MLTSKDGMCVAYRPEGSGKNVILKCRLCGGEDSIHMEAFSLNVLSTELSKFSANHTSCSVAPEPTKNGITFFPLPESQDKGDYYTFKEEYFPRNKLPKVPKGIEDMVNNLFFKGGRLPEFDPRVDKQKAATYLKILLNSWSVSHEQKITTVAYAIWVLTNPRSIDKALNK